MQRKVLTKVLVVALALVTLLPFAFIIVSAQEMGANTYVDYQLGEKTPAEQADMYNLTWKLQQEEYLSYLEDWTKTQDAAKIKKEQMDKLVGALEGIRSNLPALVEAINQNPGEGESFDTDVLISSVLSMASDVLVVLVPYGTIAAVAIDLFNSIFESVMKGPPGPSETALMEDRLNSQFKDVKEQLVEMENQLVTMANQINAQTDEIINAMTVAFDNAEAKEELRKFKLSEGQYDFSYDLYRNYLYGTIEGNSYSNTAYNAWLKKAIQEDESAELKKLYYDCLYDAIMDNRDAYLQVLLGSGETKSIVKYYYDVVCANPSLLKEEGMTPELATVMFAYDLYQTELMSQQVILTCNVYQYTQMLLEGSDIYYYGTVTGDSVTRDGIDTMAESLQMRLAEIEASLKKDLVDVLGISEHYIIKEQSGNFFELTKPEGADFAKICVDQTLYLYNVPSEICELFEFEPSLFSYSYSVDGGKFSETDGIIPIGEGMSALTVALNYDGSTVSTFSFNVEKDGGFSGFCAGSGTAEDPYLISSAEQFKKIANGLGCSYRLVENIDMGGATILPFGQTVSSKGIVVNKAFDGNLDGGGYTVSNFTVMGYGNHAGLFSLIDSSGVVTNLTLNNVTVTLTSQTAEEKNHFIGIVAGENNGTVKYCNVTGDVSKATTVVSAEVTDTTNLNRPIGIYAGGIAGKNSGLISCCRLSNMEVKASATRNFAGGSVGNNKVFAFVGGVCGENTGAIGYSSVKESVKLTAFGKAIYNQGKKVYPFVTAYAGGITGKTEDVEKISKVFSAATAEATAALSDEHWFYDEHYDNCKDDGHAYVPQISNSNLEGIRVGEQELETLLKTEDPTARITYTYGNNEHDVLCGDLKTDTLKFYLDGKEIKCEVLEVFGFNTYNEAFSEVRDTATVFCSTVIEGKTLYFTRALDYTVKANSVVDASVSGIQEVYMSEPGERHFTPIGLTLHYTYAIGEAEFKITSASDVSWSGNSSAFGTQTMTLVHNGNTITFDIVVVCGHGSVFTDPSSGYKHDKANSVSPTCDVIGYDLYVCGCGDEKYYYYPKLEHKPDTENPVGKVDATCTTTGETGDIHCALCGFLLEESQTTPCVPHEYEYYDDDKHVCHSGNEDHYENHHYTVSEYLETRVKNGVESYYIVYMGTCSCKKDGFYHTKKIADENTTTAKTESLPTVIVSNGYALHGGDEVVVYVQLKNNPGFDAANFGIRYSDKLILISKEDGDLLKGSLISAAKEVNQGWNFAWASAGTLSTADGNLLKLVFQIPEDAKLDDVYEISVVYGMGKTRSDTPIEGGFLTDDAVIPFVTRTGNIKVVEHLPGDVDEDGDVDLMDAVLVARLSVGVDDPEIKNDDYVDVNLDGKPNIKDAASILRYLVGGYGENLLPPDFEIVLNTNAWDETIGTNTVLSVNVYDDVTYSEAGLAAPMRTGYKFLGWSYKMFTNNEADFVKLDVDKIHYEKSQKVQTLYAQWELNRFVFDDNGSTYGKIDDMIYGDGVVTIPENPYKKSYTIYFVHDLQGYEFEKPESTLEYQFGGFKVSNDNVVYETLESVREALLEGHEGKVVLQVVWTKPTLEDVPEGTIEGYSPTIAWYTDSDKKIRLDLDDENTYAVISKEGAKIYAKHTVLKYQIQFDANGGNLTNLDAVSGTKYDLNSTYKFPEYTVSKPGYVFAGWKSENGKVSLKKTATEFAYIPETQGEILKMVAVWIPNLSYELNDDGKTYTVTGLGEFTGSTLVIPEKHPDDGKPIVIIAESAFSNCKNLTSVRIPDSVTSIGYNAFYYCTSLKTVTFGESSALANIGYQAFYKCTSLTTITIPASVTGIGTSAFAYCSSLEFNEYENAYYLGDSSNLYLYFAKPKTTSLATCNIHKNTRFIGYSAFEDCTSLTSLTIPSGVTSIDSRAFYKCTSLVSITIPASVMSIGDAFYKCTSLDVVYIENLDAWCRISLGSDNSPLVYADNLYLNDTPVTHVQIPKGVTKIEEYQFSFSSLQTITIPSSVTSIGEGAFSSCSSLTSITIPNSVTSIGEDAFNGCTRLASLTFGANSKLKSIGYDAFRECTSLTSVTIPSSLTSIGSYAFMDCTGLTSVHIYDLAAWCKISFKSNFSNPLYYAKNLYLNDTLVTNLVIPEGVTSIGNNAFYYCKNLTSITIPSSVTSIGYDAFQSCSSLTSVTFGANSKLESIGSHAFGNCNGLVSITIPSSVTSIGSGAFQSCSFESITIPSGVTSISSYAFRSCDSLMSITIPSSVTSIGDRAFYSCNSLKTVTFGENSQLTSIGEDAFYWCENLTPITIPSGVTSIGEDAFYRCPCTVSFNANGGTVSQSTKTVYCGSSYGDLPTPTRSDYTFDGWFTAASGGEQITNNSWMREYLGSVTLYAHWTYVGCFTGDTQITLADGSTARLDSLNAGDVILSWNAITGEFEAMPISMFWNHGEAVYDVLVLTFSNGKTLKVVTEHGFFDATLNKYVYIDASNYNEYIGHEFACLNENGAFENVTLIAVDYKKELSSCYSLRTACNDNAIVDGFLTLTHEDIPGFLTYFEFGDGYMYDEDKMQEDIEKYGLYTYDDWKEYVSYEEFVALNGQYLTIVIGKGYLTYEDILGLIAGMR